MTSYYRVSGEGVGALYGGLQKCMIPELHSYEYSTYTECIHYINAKNLIMQLQHTICLKAL